MKLDTWKQTLSWRRDKYSITQICPHLVVFAGECGLGLCVDGIERIRGRTLEEQKEKKINVKTDRAEPQHG
jgi:hypothetical protein